MGAPKQKWTAEEETALRAGVARYGIGKWSAILKDTEFSGLLRSRSNVDLKDKWRNIHVMESGLGSRQRGRPAFKGTQLIPKPNHKSVSISTAVEKSPEVLDTNQLTVWTEASPITISKKSISRLDDVALKAIAKLKEPHGSTRSSIALYIEERYSIPSDFEKLLAKKLKRMVENGKLIKVNNHHYRLSPRSVSWMNTTPSNRKKKGNHLITKAQIDKDVDKVSAKAEAAAAAAKAVAEAEGAIAEANEAAREADNAEAEAEAAYCFAEAARKAFSCTNNYPRLEFKTEMEAVTWAHSVARELGIVLVRGRSDFTHNQNSYIQLVCDKGGDMRINHQPKSAQKVKRIESSVSTSKKCGCKFKVKLKNDKKKYFWEVILMNEMHNHSLNRQSQPDEMEEEVEVAADGEEFMMEEEVDKEVNEEVAPSERVNEEVPPSEHVVLIEIVNEEVPPSDRVPRGHGKYPDLGSLSLDAEDFDVDAEVEAAAEYILKGLDDDEDPIVKEVLRGSYKGGPYGASTLGHARVEEESKLNAQTDGIFDDNVANMRKIKELVLKSFKGILIQMDAQNDGIKKIFENQESQEFTSNQFKSFVIEKFKDIRNYVSSINGNVEEKFYELSKNLKIHVESTKRRLEDVERSTNQMIESQEALGRSLRALSDDSLKGES